MTSAVTARQNNNSPHLNAKSSPRATRTSAQNADSIKKEASSGNDSKPVVPTIRQPDPADTANTSKESTAAPANAPLAPPPKPNQNGDNDYFGGQHNGTHLSKEPNPFEIQFGAPSETPGKTQLPGVNSLTSPASLLPVNTPGWPGSLRSGPLSPAMLTGPTGTNDYFNSDHHFAASFPTPNESSLRTGLTPGGGGSMFPQPSPNSQALYNQLQSGGATPGTLDFHRTAMTARAQVNNYNVGQNGGTSHPQQNPNIQPDLDSKTYNHGQNHNNQQDQHDPFGSHQTNDAANGLFMLARASGQGPTQPYSIPQQPQHNYQQQQQQQQGGQDKRANQGSIVSTMSGSTDGQEAHYSEEADVKPQTRNGRGKKGSTGKASTTGKRKTEETPSKAQAQVSKKQRGSSGNVMPMEEEPDDDDDDDMGNMDDETGADGKKMTDEEKRKNFLERNRVAALKCRQRKKQWLANLQQKVEIFSTENDALAATVTQLREEIVGLKTLLLAHKDCPVSQAQGISGMAMQQIAGDSQHYANPYGMAMGQGGPGMGQQAQMQQGQMQRS